jgi:hypothetical protein
LTLTILSCTDQWVAMPSPKLLTVARIPPGGIVPVMVDETRSAGVDEAKFDATGLSSGVYFYRLQAGDFVQTKRLVVLKVRLFALLCCGPE